MSNIQVKICGITTVANAETAGVANADAIGFNFYAKSKRYVEPETAAKIAQSVGGEVAFVGVFVNALVDEIISISKTVSLTHVQLHGEEHPEIVARIKESLSGVKIIRAVRIMGNDLDAAQLEITQWQTAGVDWILLDAGSLEAYGGTGEQLDWAQLEKLSFGVPWLLAGGLETGNVAEAIRIANPIGVDVASGVESAPGIKDADLVNEFTRTARAHL